MDKIRQYLSNPLILFIVCLVIGLIVGVFVIGYWLMAGTVDQLRGF